MPFALARPAHHELVIKKSRFIACVESVTGREAALDRVAQLKAEHPSAAHVCWALLAGGQSAANDDGEPGGTAGRPMLEVLRHQDLEGVLATVVRYFGGVKLGAGGLMRAYTDAVAQALLTAQKVALIPQAHLACSVPYALEGWVRRELDLAKALLTDVTHASWVSLSFDLPQCQATQLMARLNEGGRGQLVWLDNAHMTLDDKVGLRASTQG
ncbi:IMPACT family protein [Limnohabitans sp. DCL3]|uniref:IMPACT family protein n=1 Tax=Limnohabitans sp. DCL3 TaxID=3374103 RepID=UPI003A868071